jgi:hypothetical protein
MNIRPNHRIWDIRWVGEVENSLETYPLQGFPRKVVSRNILQFQWPGLTSTAKGRKRSVRLSGASTRCRLSTYSVEKLQIQLRPKCQSLTEERRLVRREGPRELNEIPIGTFWSSYPRELRGASATIVYRRKLCAFEFSSFSTE